MMIPRTCIGTRGESHIALSCQDKVSIEYNTVQLQTALPLTPKGPASMKPTKLLGSKQKKTELLVQSIKKLLTSSA